MQNEDHFNEALRELMDINKVSVADIRKALDGVVSVSTIYNWRNGKALPDILYLTLLAQYFQISTDYLTVGLRSGPEDQDLVNPPKIMYDNSTTSFVTNLINVLEYANIDFERLVELSGIYGFAIQAIIDNPSCFRLTEALRIAEALDLPLSYFVDPKIRSAEAYYNARKELELTQVVRHLDIPVDQMIEVIKQLSVLVREGRITSSGYLKVSSEPPSLRHDEQAYEARVLLDTMKAHRLSLSDAILALSTATRHDSSSKGPMLPFTPSDDDAER